MKASTGWSPTASCSEWAEVFHGIATGPAGPVELHRDAGRDVLLEIDVQGAHEVRARVPEAVMILLEPPSLEELERRLRERATEDEASIAERLAKADWELSSDRWFDHVVVNDELERASSQVAAIIEASRARSDFRSGGERARPHGGPFSMIEPKIDDLLAAVDSKYTLVILAAKRARDQLLLQPARRGPRRVRAAAGRERVQQQAAVDRPRGDRRGQDRIRAPRGTRRGRVMLAGRRVLLGVTGGIAAYKRPTSLAAR